MSSFSEIKEILYSSNMTNGQRRKSDSDKYIEYTWDEDLQSKKCYIYDYFHDDAKGRIKGYDPSRSLTKTPIDAKFIITQYGTISKDQVEYHLQFKPSQKCPLDYYKTDYSDKYWAEYPIGLYIDIPDDEGVYRKWMIVSSEYANQFKKYSILPCNYYFTWVNNGKLYGMCGVARLRNSYNSGVWTDYKITTVENQDQAFFPLNYITEDIIYIDSNEEYNQRFIISPPVKHPNAWTVSKLELMHPIGLYKITLSQTKFNPVADTLVDFNLDSYSGEKIRCWVADYNKSNIITDATMISKHTPNDSMYTCSIICSSNIYRVKVRGGYKKITAIFTSVAGEETDKFSTDNLIWNFSIDGNDAKNLLDIKPLVDGKTDSIKIKFLGDESYLSKTLDVNVKDSSGTITASAKLDITSL